MQPEITLVSAVRSAEQPYVTLNIVISDGENSEKRVFIVPERYFIASGLKKGTITVRAFDETELEAKRFEAERRAAGILGYGANSKNMLLRKLKQRGYTAQTAEYAVRELESKGYINENEDAARLAVSCLGKLWSKRHILSFVYEKGYREGALEAARDALDEVDFFVICGKYIARKYKTVPKEPDERKKITAALARAGFTMSEIRECMCKLANG